MDKKRSVPSECDCPGVLPIEEQVSKDNSGASRDGELGAEVVPLTSISTPLQLSTGLGPAPAVGLQFVPNTLVSTPHLQFAPFQVGTGSVPLQYGHLSALGMGQAAANQPVTSQTAAAAAVAAQQLQVIGPSGVSSTSSSVTSASASTPPVTGAALSNKSQVKKFLLHSPQLGLNTTELSGQQRGSPMGPLLHTSPAAPHPPSLSQPSKKSKKQVRGNAIKQEREGHLTLPVSVDGAVVQDAAAASHHQPVAAGLPLDSSGQGVVYANTHTMAHFPATMAAPTGTLPLTNGSVTTFGQGLHMNETGLMVATPPAPAKILNDQLPDMITTPAAQVSYTALLVTEKHIH